MPLTHLETEKRLFTPAPSCRVPDAIIRREGIRWTGGEGGRPLRLELAFENPSRLPSASVVADVEVAPFGAFLEWSPLARVTVPSVPPGGRRILTATLDGDAALPRPPAPGPLSLGFAATLWNNRISRAHFVGNLNVYVNRAAPVERHVQSAVGLRPGRDNLAMFYVGDGSSDRYAFSMGTVEPGWDVEIMGAVWGVPVEISFGVKPLRIRPAPRAESGGISILVERESTRQVVPVEFELDVAARSKCFFF